MRFEAWSSIVDWARWIGEGVKVRQWAHVL